MSDIEHRALKDRERALQAQGIIDHPLFKEAFDLLQAEIMEAWRDTGTAQAETFKRERLWLAVNLLGKVRDSFVKVIENGKVARAHLAAIEGKRQTAA